MTDMQELMVQLLEDFQSEGREILDRLGACLVALEFPDEGEAQAAITSVRRDLHTLKGAASAVGLVDVRTVVHAVEGYVEQDQSLDSTRLDVLHKALEYLQSRVVRGEEADLAPVLEMLSSGRRPAPVEPPTVDDQLVPEPVKPPEPTPEPEPEMPPPLPTVEPSVDDERGGAQDIRVRTEKLDSLQSSISELVVVGLQQSALHQGVRQAHKDLSDLRGSWRDLHGAVRGHKDAVEDRRWKTLDNRLTEFGEEVKALHRSLFGLANQSANSTGQLKLVSEALLEGMKRVRMMPVGPFLQSYGLTLRQAARALGKQVRLRCLDRDIEVDRLILEPLREPLLHILRNAVAHGIEAPAERVRLGKDEVGEVRLEAERDEDQVLIRVVDDGSGIDPSAVLRTARRAGLVVGGIDDLTDEKLLEIISTPRFTTARTLDEVSGRGIGMDVVLNRILDLRGSLRLRNRPGEGCEFLIRLPASMATIQGLVLAVGPYLFGIPLDVVERTLRVRPDSLGKVGGEQVLFLDGDPISTASLASLVGCEEEVANQDRCPALILKVGETRLTILVDDIPGELPLVIKPFGPQFAEVKHFSGGAIQADGSILPVLEPLHLLARVAGISTVASASGEELEAGPRTVLVVDDSITTRTLERNILEASGYRVVVAIDGVEALELLRSDPAIEVVVTDLDMPRMDGLELCRQVRASEFAHLPVIMVTSLGAEEERRRGAEAGADAYIVKGNFQQEHFLGTIRRLTG